jgi:hypothetical protein
MLLAATDSIVNLSSQTRALAVVVAVLFLILILDLVRRRKLQERYTVVWFGAGVALLLLALVPGLLGWIAGRAGITDTNAALFAITLMVAGLLILNLTVVVSKQAEQITRMSQELAILRSEEELEATEEEEEAPTS